MHDPGEVSWLRLLIAFAVVLALLAAFGYALKYVTQRGLLLPKKGARAKRLQLVEHLAIDTRRRLVLVRCDNQEHLLLLGGQSDIVVAPIPPPADPPQAP